MKMQEWCNSHVEYFQLEGINLTELCEFTNISPFNDLEITKKDVERTFQSVKSVNPTLLTSALAKFS